jgi:transcriptional regulator with XRE-family HTH domain
MREEYRQNRTEEEIRAAYHIRAARKRLGYTLKEVGKLLGMSLYTIQNYESGKSRPDPHTMERIATLYRIPVEELLPTINKTDAIANLYTRLTPTSQAVVVQFLRYLLARQKSEQPKQD